MPRKLTIDNVAEDLLRIPSLGPSALLSGVADLLLEKLTRRNLNIHDREKCEPAAQKVMDLLERCDPFDDTLGSLYMAMACRSKQSGLGQFFTPSAIARMNAAFVMSGPRPDKPVITVHDPACGAGAMLLACMEVMAANGDLARGSFSGIDIDPLCARMCAAQLVWAAESSGQMPAHLAVVTGDTLRMQMSDVILLATNPALDQAIAAELPFVGKTLAAVWHPGPGNDPDAVVRKTA